MKLYGRVDLASALADESLAYAKAAGDPWTLAMAAHARAVTAVSPSELRERVDEAAPLLQSVGNAFFLAVVFHMGAFRALRNGSDDDASRFAGRAAALQREFDDPFIWMLLLRKVGLAALFTGDTEAARDAFREQLEHSRDLVVQPAAFEALYGLAAVAAADDDLDRAARLYGAAATFRYGDPRTRSTPDSTQPSSNPREPTEAPKPGRRRPRRRDAQLQRRDRLRPPRLAHRHLRLHLEAGQFRLAMRSDTLGAAFRHEVRRSRPRTSRPRAAGWFACWYETGGAPPMRRRRADFTRLAATAPVSDGTNGSVRADQEHSGRGDGVPLVFLDRLSR